MHRTLRCLCAAVDGERQKTISGKKKKRQIKKLQRDKNDRKAQKEETGEQRQKISPQFLLSFSFLYNSRTMEVMRGEKEKTDWLGGREMMRSHLSC